MPEDKDTSAVTRLMRKTIGRKPRVRKKYGWRSEALNVLDAVLSLMRQYDNFAFPRVEAFAERNRSVRTVEGLSALMQSYSSPLAFSHSELNYNDAKRAKVLAGVVKSLCRFKEEHGSLKKWARQVGPRDYRMIGVKGFGPAGFQYLRMLFGVQTAKPDIYIRRFVSRAVRRKVTVMKALELFEAAGKALNWPVREVDGVIWAKYARG